MPLDGQDVTHYAGCVPILIVVMLNVIMLDAIMKNVMASLRELVKIPDGRNWQLINPTWVINEADMNKTRVHCYKTLYFLLA
jgi:hypothetical protein